MEDMALLHHWSIVTSQSVGLPADVASLWQTVFPQLGFKSPYVMHSILSLAALHLAYLNQADRQSYVLSAARHHNKSLVGFQEAIDQFGTSDSIALFVNSTLVFQYAFRYRTSITSSK